jgi:nucleoid DNA-binding protein
MEELVKLVSKKTGLNEATSKMAVNLVIEYLKKKLPKAVGVQIDMFLKNEGKVSAAADVVGDLLGAAAKAKKPATKSKK